MSRQITQTRSYFSYIYITLFFLETCTSILVLKAEYCLTWAECACQGPMTMSYWTLSGLSGSSRAQTTWQCKNHGACCSLNESIVFLEALRSSSKIRSSTRIFFPSKKKNSSSELPTVYAGCLTLHRKGEVSCESNERWVSLTQAVMTKSH